MSIPPDDGICSEQFARTSISCDADRSGGRPAALADDVVALFAAEATNGFELALDRDVDDFEVRVKAALESLPPPGATSGSSHGSLPGRRVD